MVGWPGRRLKDGRRRVSSGANERRVFGQAMLKAATVGVEAFGRDDDRRCQASNSRRWNK
jgi:hypothetical protein